MTTRLLQLAWLCLPVAVLAADGPPIPLRHPRLEGEARESRDRPAQAEAFFLENRLPPGANRFPVEKLLAAREHARGMPLHSAQANTYLDADAGTASAEAQSLAWTALGPGNVGGRTRVLRFSPANPGTMYAAGVAGGVWKSTNGGASWTPKGDLMANMAVNALAIDPTNASVLYAGTGEGYFNTDRVQGAGIFKSSDGGETWTQLPATAPPGSSDFAFVNDLLVSANNHNVVYAATGTGLWRSINAGTSWTRQIDAANAEGCFDIALRPNLNPDTAVVSCGTFNPGTTESGIWRSAAANTTSPSWSHRLGPPGSGAAGSLANMGRTSLAIAPSAGATQYALISCSPVSANGCGIGNAFEDGLLAVYKSTDSGLTWAPTYASTFDGNKLADLLLTNPAAQFCDGQSGFNQGWYDNAIAVDPTNANRVFVGGIDLFRSDDGGASWGAISYWWIPNEFAQYAHADQHAIVFHPNYNGGTEKRVYVGNDGGLFVSSDAASATRAISGTNVCAGNSAQLRGASWTDLDNGYGVTQFYHGTPYPSGTRYIGGTQDNGTLRGSDSAGANAWSEIEGGDGGYTAINPNTSGGATVLYAENTGISIRKSTNDGLDFSDAITGILDTDCGRFINPFAMDPNNPARLYTSHNVLWRTANSAVSWQQASAALPGSSCDPGAGSSERFSALAVANGDPNLLVAGSNRGRLCRLTNADGSNASTMLQDCSTPAGTGVVSNVAFDPNDTTRVYASFSTISVLPLWRSTNSGASWNSISGSGATGLPDVGAQSVAVSPFDPDTIYVGTDVGVFVTTDGGAHWARENTGFANVRTDRLVFNAVDTQAAQLFAFTHGRGVFRTTVHAPPPVADLSITVSDGKASTNAGATVNYTIAVANPVAAPVTGVAVTDTFPAVLSACTWTCSAGAGGSCPASGSGNINATVALGANGSATFTATCTLAAGATGTLTDTATVSYAHDPNGANNSATDVDAIVPRADVAVTLGDGVTSVDAGAGVIYTITVSNLANVAIANVGLSDAFPAALDACAWTCSASAGSACPAAGNGDIAATLSLAAKGTATFHATCAVSADASGTLVDTATASYANDPAPANNSATDTDAIRPLVDVGVSMTDGVDTVIAGDVLHYLLVAGNNSGEAAPGVHLHDAFPAALTGCYWLCEPSSGSCPTFMNNGDIDVTLTVPGNGGVFINVYCNVAPGAFGSESNTFSVEYANDPNAFDNSITDTNTIVPQSDVGVALTDGVSMVAPGATVRYRIDVANHSPHPISASVNDVFNPARSGCTWTCVASSGGSCPSGGNGNIQADVELATDGAATLSVTCTLAPDASGLLDNSASVSANNDPVPANNQASDSDAISAQLIFNDSFEL